MNLSMITCCPWKPVQNVVFFGKGQVHGEIESRLDEVQGPTLLKLLSQCHFKATKWCIKAQSFII